MTTTSSVRICFVCLGNICRSPTAEGVMRHLADRAGVADQLVIDSAGTGNWHVGEPPDERATAAARRRGIALEGAARQFARADFDRFDWVVAMDRSNARALEKLAGERGGARAKIVLLRAFDAEAPAGELDVPDPYYGGPDGFEEVIDICLRGCSGLLARIRERL